MKDILKYVDFLKSVDSFNEIYCSIKENGELAPLYLGFWEWQDILQAQKLQVEWQVSRNYIPFYGDWHDLYCIHKLSGKVISINDDRKVVCEWESIQEFIDCLSTKELDSGFDIENGFIGFE